MSLLSSRFNTGPYNVTRSLASGSQDSGGHWTPSSSTTVLSINGSLQPLSERDLRDLKEGKRADDMRVFFTNTAMFTVDQGHDVQDFMDVADDNGIVERYRVMKVGRYTVLSGHFKVSLERVAVP